MSRRHKENDIDNTNKIQQEAHGANAIDNLLNITVTRRSRSFIHNFSGLLTKAITNALFDSKVEVDDKYVKIPRSYFEPTFDEEWVEETTQGRGRPFIKRLFSSIADNKVVKAFKKTLSAAKKKCAKWFKDVGQYAVCFLKGASAVFSPNDDLYGKLSHYHRLIKDCVDGVPTRKTLNNYLKWYEEWHPVNYLKEDFKQKAKRFKYEIWEKLIEWIQSYLLDLTKKDPEYALA